MGSRTNPAGSVLSEKKLSRILKAVTWQPLLVCWQYPWDAAEYAKLQVLGLPGCLFCILKANKVFTSPPHFPPRSKLNRTTLPVSLSANITKIKGKEQNKCQYILGVVREERGKVHFAYAAVEISQGTLCTVSSFKFYCKAWKDLHGIEATTEWL